jgi:hypothetical protein
VSKNFAHLATQKHLILQTLIVPLKYDFCFFYSFFFHSLMEDTRDIFWYDFKYDAIFLVVSGLYKICMVLVVTFVLGSHQA